MDRVSPFGRLVRRAAPPLVLAVGIGGYIALAATRETPKPRVPEVPVLLVETAAVEPTEQAADIASDGVVVPFREVTLSSQVDGRVIEKSDSCRAGRVVQAGDLLVKVDPADYELKVAELEQQRDQAKASLDELAVEISNADASAELAGEDVRLQQSEVRRIAGLRSMNVSTESMLDAAKLKELASRNSLVTLQNSKRLLEAQRARLGQSVKLAETQLQQARVNLQRTTITAPFDGVVVSTKVEEDGYLKKGDVIAAIDDSSAAEVRTSLEMRKLAMLRAELPPDVAAGLGPYDPPPVRATVTYEILGNVYEWRGQLARYEGAGIDEKTRTVPCRIRVPDPRSVSLRDGRADLPVAPPSALVRGMYVKVLLHSPSTGTRLSIPERAVRPGNVVWAVRDGKLAKFELTGTRQSGDRVLVSPQVTGLKPGDAVVVSPLPIVQDGQAVRTESKPAAAEVAAKREKPAPETPAKTDEALAAPVEIAAPMGDAAVSTDQRPAGGIGRFSSRAAEGREGQGR